MNILRAIMHNIEAQAQSVETIIQTNHRIINMNGRLSNVAKPTPVSSDTS